MDGATVTPDGAVVPPADGATVLPDGGGTGSDAGTTPDGTTPPGTPTSRLVAACGTVCSRPLDAVPTANGETIYFTAFTPDGVPGVFRVAAAGGAITLVAGGGGLTLPVGIAIGRDDATLYIADLSATRGGDTTAGAVFTVPAAGGTPMVLDVGREVVRPASITVSTDGAHLFVTGERASDGARAVFEVPVGGGTAEVRADDLADPSGVSQAPDGRVIVHDTVRSGEHSATAVLVMGSGTVPYAAGLVAGYPAGLSFSMDGRALLFSGSLGRTAGRLTYSPAPGEVMNPPALSMGMVQPLGLHRARGANVYAVADEAAMDNGAIFVVQ
jgi:sugar lactone lactonase YvrE